MNTLPIALHNLLVQNVLDMDFQSFVDNYNEKYDAVQIDGFEKAPLSINYTFAQLVASTHATALPAYVDPESPGYEMQLNSIQGKTGNIPTMKAFYRLNRVRLMEQMQLAQRIGHIDAAMQNVFMQLYDESTEGLIKSYYNALTNQRMQLVSTGQFVINATNNPRGIQGVTIGGFGIATSTLADAKKWFVSGSEVSNTDPLKDIKTWRKYVERTLHYAGPLQMEISQDLFDLLIEHSAVKNAIAANLYPTGGNLAVAAVLALGDDARKAAIERITGVKIVVRDTKAYVLTPNQTTHDLDETAIDNFNPYNVAFVPQGTIGDIQGVQPLTLGYDPEDIAQFDGGRLILSQRAQKETHSIYIESEAAQICVPSEAKHMYIVTVAK